MAKEKKKIVLVDAPGSPSKLCTLLFLFPPLFYQHPASFPSPPPRTQNLAHVLLLAAAATTAEIPRYLFILLSQKRETKKMERGLRLQKAARKSKSISAPVRTMAYFAFLPSFFFFFYSFFLPIIRPQTIRRHLKCTAEKKLVWKKRQKNKGGRKFFDHRRS